nr:hypothetical protein [Tanacetum cinerariifolium]
MEIRYLDTETTGLYPNYDEVLEVAIIDEAGQVLFNSRVRPIKLTEWPEGQAINGISPADVLRPEVPTLAELAPVLAALLAGYELRIFNAAFDTSFLTDVLAIASPGKVVCLMIEFADLYGRRYGGQQWQSLAAATSYVLHEWQGEPHSALADTFAARAVGRYLFDPAERLAVDAEIERLRATRKAEREAEHQDWEVERTLLVWEQQAEQMRRARNEAFTRCAFPYIQTWNAWRDDAYQSAAALCLHDTGYPLAEWLAYSPEELALPRYGNPARKSKAGLPPLPADLVPAGTHSGGGVYFLKLPPPVVAMWHRRGGAAPELLPVYSLDGLTQG